MYDQSKFIGEKTLSRIPLSDFNHFQVVEVQSEMQVRTDMATKVH